MTSWVMAFLLAVLLVTGIYMPAGPMVMDGGTVVVTAHSPVKVSEEQEWEEYHALAVAEYSAEFTRLFNGYETKWSKNGRLMIRNGHSGPYRFVKRSV